MRVTSLNQKNVYCIKQAPLYHIEERFASQLIGDNSYGHKKGRFHFHSSKTETDKTKAISIRNDLVAKVSNPL